MSCHRVSVCLSLSVTLTRRYYVEAAEWIELIFGMEAFFELSDAMLLKEFQITPKISVLPSGTSSQTLNCNFDLM